MTLTVEIGTASSTSEAYCDVAYADSYFAARGHTLWAGLVTGDKEAALRRAADYLTATYRTRWAGRRVSATQALDWPRYQAPNADAFAAYYPSDSIPREVVQANAELALRAAAGELIEDLEPPVASESVGPVSTTYFQGASREKKFPAIDRMLAPLLRGAGGIKLVRA